MERGAATDYFTVNKTKQQQQRNKTTTAHIEMPTMHTNVRTHIKFACTQIGTSSVWPYLFLSRRVMVTCTSI